jgi:predicted regulator of Ras-like GTPase activity (Roadblock/LC7/MglB family)
MTGEAVLQEMVALRNRVAGITGMVLATRDGMLIKADAGAVDPDSLAAIAATVLAVGRRMAVQADRAHCAPRCFMAAMVTWRRSPSARPRCLS